MGTAAPKLWVAIAGVVACGAAGATLLWRSDSSPPPATTLKTLPSAATPAEPTASTQPPAEQPNPRPPAYVLRPAASTLPEQREQMLQAMREQLGLQTEQLSAVRQIIAASRWMGQGNPKVTVPAMTREECWHRRAAARVASASPECGAAHMVAVPTAEQGHTTCIDQFEFPNLPCEYPLVWVSAKDAALLCEAVGKRLCDAHEWEGACAGQVLGPDEEYTWGERRLQMEYLHNQKREILWSYGKQKDHGLCAMGSSKSPGCFTPSWQKCGTNTYPAGAFPKCRSATGVYDLHGNVAEHMNLPLKPAQLSSRGGLGQTEMKGSWFIFRSYEAHPDDCRWRARNWHGTKITNPSSHRNYHLGFRCCKSITPDSQRKATP